MNSLITPTLSFGASDLARLDRVAPKMDNESRVSELPLEDQSHGSEERCNISEESEQIGSESKGWSSVDASSVIPLPTMITLMRVFGPEDLQPWRKDLHKLDRSSIVRIFKQWNPHFFAWFHRKRGIWVPILGFREESLRRETARTVLRRQVTRDESLQ